MYSRLPGDVRRTVQLFVCPEGYWQQLGHHRSRLERAEKSMPEVRASWSQRVGAPAGIGLMGEFATSSFIVRKHVGASHVLQIFSFLQASLEVTC